LTEGDLLSVEPCFTGDPVLAPTDDKGGVESEDDPFHGIVSQDSRGVSWFSNTKGNVHPLLRGTCSLILEVRAPAKASLAFQVNGNRFEHRLEDLLVGSRTEFMRGWRSEALLVHHAVPEAQLRAALAFEDTTEGQETDFYYLRVSQENGQWAWSSPIWISR
jgi:hypothetical protein